MGKEVNIANFGKFSLKYHKPKVTVHPKNPFTGANSFQSIGCIPSYSKV